ncbi:MAG: 3'-5' exonuclease [Flavobacteriales bacterium]|nr:3'-5' exonuclease [Flavobacteriales bacterium]
MYLLFDTETSGLPRNWNAPLTDFDNWPRLVQLAYLVYDKQGNCITGSSHIIRPNGFSIPKSASQVHGITTERALREGEPLQDVLNEFQAYISQSEYIVAHNLSFDEAIMGAEFLRMQMNNLLPAKRKICTMNSTTSFCAIPGKYGYKWPTLSELHIRLFNIDFGEAHNAAADIEATARCFWELKRLGVL